MTGLGVMVPGSDHLITVCRMGEKRMRIVLRPLGHMESMMTLMHMHYRGATQGAQFVTLDRKIPTAQIVSAARTLFDSYVALRCAIDQQGNEFLFVDGVTFDDVPIRHAVVGRRDEVRNMMLHEVAVPVDPSIALWRLVVIDHLDDSEQSILFVGHHAILDVDGIYALMDELLSFVDAAVGGKSYAAASYPLAPAIDTYLQAPAGKLAAAPATPAIPFEKYVPVSERRTAISSCTLSATQWHSLGVRCNNDGIKSNSLLMAAVCCAAIDAGLSSPLVSCRSAVSLRDLARLGSATADRLGCYIGIAETTLECGNGDMQHIARDYEKKLLTYIVRSLSRRPEFSMTSLLERIAVLRDSTSFLQGIAISNLGEVRMRRQYDNFTVLDFCPVANRVAGNFAFVGHVYLFGEELRVDFVYTKPLISKETVDRVRRAFIYRVEAYLNDAEKRTDKAA